MKRRSVALFGSQICDYLAMERLSFRPGMKAFNYLPPCLLFRLRVFDLRALTLLTNWTSTGLQNIPAVTFGVFPEDISHFRPKSEKWPLMRPWRGLRSGGRHIHLNVSPSSRIISTAVVFIHEPFHSVTRVKIMAHYLALFRNM